MAQGRDVVAAKCFQCHGASMITSEHEDARKWNRITREMQRFSQRIPGKNPISEPERVAATAYLARILGEKDDDDHQEDEREEEEEKEEEAAASDAGDGDQRGRGRGRGRGRRGRGA